jgi:hypothetical protein
MRILEVTRSAEHRTPDELTEALEEAEAAREAALEEMEVLRARREALAGGPCDRDVPLLDQEIEAKRRHVASIEGALAEVERRYRALTAWQPRQRPGALS